MIDTAHFPARGVLLTGALVALAGCAPTTHPVPLRAERLSDIAVATGQTTLTTLASSFNGTTPAQRRARNLAVLATAAYERNADDALVRNLVDGASTVARGSAYPVPVSPVARRSDLWALVDSAATAPTADERVTDIVALQEALVRAQQPVLGAPSCDVWEGRAVEIAARLRIAPPPPPAPPVVEPPPPPAPAPKPAPVTVLTRVPSGVHFALDKSDLAPASRRVLDSLVAVLREQPTVRLTLEGNTDVRGSKAYNEALSRRRAESVRGYLVSHGVDAARLEIVALGFSRLEVTGSGIVDHARNRRVSLRYWVDGREIPTAQQLDDLQLEAAKVHRPR